MRKRDGYRKIEIVESDSDNSITSKCNINIFTTIFLILVIISLYVLIVYLLIKAFFIYTEMKDHQEVIPKKKFNSTTNYKYIGKFNNNNNSSNIGNKYTYNEANNNSQINNTIINNPNTNNSTNTSGAIIEAIKKEILFTPSVLKNFTEEIIPKISIIILIEEKENLIKLLLSIQKQKFLEIELLIVDDNITNDKSSLYEGIKSHDKRVKLKEYKNKVGNLKKRNDAINESKGEYIIFIDSDDYFTPNENSFQEIYSKAVENNLDILEFKSFHFISNDNNIIYQPRLFDLMYFSTDNYCDIKQFHLSGKLIKKSLFIEAFNNIDKNYFEKDMNNFEQNLLLLIILKKAKSLLILNVLQTAKICTISDPYYFGFNQQDKRDFLLYLKFFIQNTDNNVPEKRLVSNLFINYVIRKGIKFEEKEEIKLLNENINLLLDCAKISDYDHYIMNNYKKDYSSNIQQ